MNAQPSVIAPPARPAGHVTITPSVLYFGTPVVLLSTENEDGTVNLAPMSSAWALGQVIVLGPGAGEEFLIVQAAVLRVHADPRIVVPGTQHVDPRRWSPLIYNFRHYYGLGPELGHTFRSQTPHR